MGDIRPLKVLNTTSQQEEIFYPATTTDAIADRIRQKSLADILAELDNNGGAYDISAAHNNATYADLESALGTNGANVPAIVRKGGMSIKFVQSSDNNYKQFRLMANTFSTTVSDWQGEDDVPTNYSKNLVNSGGVRKALNELGYYIESNEFVYAIEDKDGKFLAGMKTDGSVEWEKGIPKPIQEALDTIEESKFTELPNAFISPISTPNINTQNGYISFGSGEPGIYIATTKGKFVVQGSSYKTDGEYRAYFKDGTANTASSVIFIYIDTIDNKFVSRGQDKVFEDTQSRYILLGGVVCSYTSGGTYTANSFQRASFPFDYTVNGAKISQSSQIADNIISTAKIVDGAITKTKINDGVLYEIGDKIEKTTSFAAGLSYPWYDILEDVINVGDVIEWSVETSSTDYYWIATRTGTGGATEHTDAFHGGNQSGVFKVTQAAGKFALGIRQASSYTGTYKIKVRKVQQVEVNTDNIVNAAVTNAKLASDSVSKEKIENQLSYELGIGKEATASFASGQSYPWYYIFSGIDIKIGDAIEWSVETADNSDNYWMATRDANNNTVQNTSIDKGSRSGIFVATVAADKFALGIRQGSSYTGNYKIKARKVEPEIADLENRVEALEQGSPSGTGILDLNPEKEILPILKDFRHRIRNGAFVEQTKQLVLLQLTDQHGDETRMNRAMQFASQYGAYIDDVIHTGDLVYDNWADGVDWLANIQNKNNILQVIGNHDVAVKAGSDGKVYTNPNDLSQYIETSGYVNLDKTTHTVLGYKNSDNEMVWVNYTDIYGRYIAPYVSNWGVVQPSNAATQGLNYYYKDYTEQGIRLIILDSMMYDTAQDTWLISVLADAKTNGYGVIIAEHYPIQLDGFEYCAFTSSGMKDVTDFYQSEGDAATLAGAQLAVDNFMNAGGEFICWLAGHTHKDFCGTLKNYPKQVMIVSNITGLNHLAWGEDVRTVGTKEEDSFSIISIDRYKKIVRLYRVGNQWDRYGRHKVSMAFDYRAAKMIYSS